MPIFHLFVLIACLLLASPGDAIDLRLEPVASGFNRPLFVTHAGDGSGRLFVVEQGGLIRIVRNGSVLPTPFLDVSALLSQGSERGLLGLAFAPDYAQSGRFYINYTDTSGGTVVARLAVGSNPDVADPASRVTLLQFAQPFSNHNGGWIGFGPDGYLYIASGDGGSANDPQNNAQNLGTLLGKLLRLDVSGANASIPPGNPYLGVVEARPEIWAYGLRNPWRASFDRQSGDLWIADVGQNRLEEINFQPANAAGGQNYGWKLFEASQCGPGLASCSPIGLTAPVAEYGRDGGCSVTGGYVYRGRRYPAMQGLYFFADYCSGRIQSLRRSAPGGSAASFVRTIELESGRFVSSFGEDEAGELYLVDYTGSVHRLSDGPAVTNPPIDQHYSGTWYDPAQSGHGLFVEVLPGAQLVAWWFTFSPDGQQSWFGGVGPISGNRATIAAVRTMGGRFIPAFDPSAVQNQPFGTLTLEFTDCREGRIDFDLPQGYGQGSMRLVRLTEVAGAACTAP